MNSSSRSCRSTSFLKKSCLSVLVAIALGASAHAQQPAEATQYAVPAGDLIQVVNEISRNSGVQIVYDIELLRGKKSVEVRGSMSLQQALDRALAGSELSWTRVNATTVSIQRKTKSSISAPGGRKTSPTPEPKRADQRNEVADLEQIVVVGSRLGTSPVESAMPIKVITRDQIDRSGAGNVAQVLSYLSEVSVNSNGDRTIGTGDGVPQGGNTNATTVQMRGMSKGTVLILINGRRAGNSASYSDTGQFDLSTVPLSLVERIEVLPAGSSAIYGGDGLVGVINIVLRRDANGFEVRYRMTSADGYATDQASAMWGKTWSRGDLTAAATWSEEGSLTTAERPLTANQDFRRFGGNDQRSSSANPATVFSLAGCPIASLCYLPLENRGNLPGLDSAFAVVPAGSNGSTLSPTDFLPTQGQQNKSSTSMHLRSAEKSYGITTTGRLSITSSTEAFVEVAYTKRDVPAFELPLQSILPEYAYPSAVLPASNPFNPFGVDVGVGYLFNRTGVYTTYSQNHLRGAFGLRGKKKRFDWEVSAWQSTDRSKTGGSKSFDDAAVLAALASNDPGLALNPFVSNEDAPASPEVLQSLAIPLKRNSRNRTQGFTGYIRGKLAELPSGSITGLVGLEGQRNSFDLETDDAFVTVPSIHGSSISRAAFAEARLPILSPRENRTLERIAMTGAYRRETSERFERAATTETIGLEMRPSDTLLLRATYSTAFRPLLTYFDVQDPRFRTESVTDPELSGQRYSVRVRSGGGHPEELLPESSKNSTIGALYRPNENWSLSFSHWDTEFYNRVAYIASQTIVNNEAHYPGRVTRNQTTGVIEEIDARQVNIALMSAAGIDFDLDSFWFTPAGDLQASVSATYTYKHEEQQSPNLPVVNGLAQHRLNTWAPRWKIVPRLSWDMHGNTRMMLTGRYVSAYRDSLPLETGPNAGKHQMLGDFWLWDLNVDLSVGKLFGNESLASGAHINIGANNLFNRLPDFCAGCNLLGYDASQYDILGRTIYAELRMSF